MEGLMIRKTERSSKDGTAPLATLLDNSPKVWQVKLVNAVREEIDTLYPSGVRARPFPGAHGLPMDWAVTPIKLREGGTLQVGTRFLSYERVFNLAQRTEHPDMAQMVLLLYRLFLDGLYIREFRYLTRKVPGTTPIQYVIDIIGPELREVYQNVLCRMIPIKPHASTDEVPFYENARVIYAERGVPTVNGVLWHAYHRVAFAARDIHRYVLERNVESIVGSLPLIGWADGCVMAAPMTRAYAKMEWDELWAELRARNPAGVWEEWNDACACSLLAAYHQYPDMQWVTGALPIPEGFGAAAIRKYVLRRILWKYLILPYHGVYWFQGDYLEKGGNYLKMGKVAKALVAAWSALDRMGGYGNGAYVAPPSQVDMEMKRRYARTTEAAIREVIDPNWILAVTMSDVYREVGFGPADIFDAREVEDLSTVEKVLAAAATFKKGYTQAG